MLALDRIAAVEQDQCRQNLEEEQAGRFPGLEFLDLVNPIGTHHPTHSRGDLVHVRMHGPGEALMQVTRCPILLRIRRDEPQAVPQTSTRQLDPSRAEVDVGRKVGNIRSEEHTSELQSLMRISYAVFCLKKKRINRNKINK